MIPVVVASGLLACAMCAALASRIARRRADADRLELQRLRTLLARAPLALVAVDDRRGVLAWNAAAEYLFGFAAHDVLEQPAPACLAPLQDAASEALAGMDAVLGLPVLLNNGRGEALSLSVSVTRLPSEAGVLAWVALAEDLTVQRRRESLSLDATRAQRGALVREVHHRIKNHLHGVAGLLRQQLSDKPMLKPLLDTMTTQVLSLAAVHGLQGESAAASRIAVDELVRRIAHSVAGIMQVPVTLDASCDALDQVLVTEEESVPMAMVLNELLMNAVKHRSFGPHRRPVTLSASRTDAQAVLRIANDGFLPPRFDFSSGRSLGTGLGLVKSLLPSQGMSLAIEEDGDRVVAVLRMSPPQVAMRGPGQGDPS